MMILPLGKEQSRSQEGSLRHCAICLTRQDVFDIHLLDLPPSECRCDKRRASLLGGRGDVHDPREACIRRSGQRDGERILVDRMWPRGVCKKRASADLWLKDLTPSDELRRWFGHNPARWAEFKNQYHRELETSPRAVKAIKAYTREEVVTSLFSARDAGHNNAVCPARVLGRRAET